MPHRFISRAPVTVALASCLLATSLSPAVAAGLSGPNPEQGAQRDVVTDTTDMKDPNLDAVGSKQTVAKETDRVVVKFRDNVSDATKNNVLNAVDASTIADDTTIVKETVGNADVVETEMLDTNEQKRVVSELENKPEVEYAEPDLLIHNAAASYTSNPNDPYFGSQWGMRDIKANTAWSQATGAGTTIGIVDTGVTNHVDLNNKIVGGFDFVSDPGYSRDGNGRDGNPQDEGDWGNGTSQWHGTHVAGIAAASTNNGVGVTGVAPNARIQPLRALGAYGSGYVSDMADAVAWGAGVPVSGLGNNPHPNSVVNLSAAWDSGTCPATMKNAIDSAHRRNVPVVIAAGNTGVDANRISPANCLGAVVVGASAGPYMTGYSNWGSMLDVLAPGGAVGTDVLSTVNAGAYTPTYASYGTMNGTSMAAPHVAGTIALMKEKNPTIGVEQIRNILVSTGDSLAGYKKINADRAVRATPAATKNYVVKGAIKSHYLSHGGEARFGKPTSNEVNAGIPNTLQQTFSKDGVTTTFYWSQKTGAYELNMRNGIGRHFRDTGGVPRYGIATSDEKKTSATTAHQFFANPNTGVRSLFMYSAPYGTHVVRESSGIGSTWVKNGREHTTGFPTNDETTIGNGVVTQRFHNMKTNKKYTYDWTQKYGTHVVYENGAIGGTWNAKGRENGVGFPITDEVHHGNGVVTQKFVHPVTKKVTTYTWTAAQGVKIS